MRIGPLRHRVILQTQAATIDEYGDSTGTWSTTATLWADIRPVSGSERFSDQAIDAQVSHRIWMRYHASITTATRIKWGSRYFDINAVINHGERNHMMELHCTEVVA